MNSINKAKKAAIYIRVSTDFQAEEGYSIEAQKEQLTAYCVSKGIKNYDYYIDGGWSGSNIERPEMERLMKDVKDGKISHVIVYKLDRLSRSQKDTLYLIEDLFMPNNVDFVSLTELLDTSTPMGRAMIGILAAFAQLERENIKFRLNSGRQLYIEKGGKLGRKEGSVKTTEQKQNETPPKKFATNNFCISDRGVTWTYVPYEIALLSVGETNVTVSFDDLEMLMQDNDLVARIKQ